MKRPYPAFAMLLLSLCALGAAFTTRANAEQRLPENYQEWLAWTPKEDRRPFLVRLILSLRPWGEVGVDRAKIHLDERGVAAKGTAADAKINPQPTAFGLGLQAGTTW